MRLIIMFVAIAFAAGAFFITMRYTAKPTETPVSPVVQQVQPQETETVDVYTAKTEIPIGTVLTKELLDLHPWPKNLLLADMVTVEPSHLNDLLKMITRTPFQKGEPIILTKLANENDPSFLASSLGEGMRLVTFAVDAMTGGGGFVLPGDRVDILITHDLINGTGPSAKRETVTEILVPDVRVLAANQKSTAHGGDAPAIPTSLSVEVTSADAQKIRLTETGNGRLSVALRSLKDKGLTTIVKPSVIRDLSNVNDPPDQSVLIVRGVNRENEGVATPPANLPQGNKVVVRSPTPETVKPVKEPLKVITP